MIEFPQHAPEVAGPARPTAVTAADSTVPDSLTIDCECCALRDTDACDDCLVTFVLERDPDDAVVIDAAEERAVRMLERAGLLPSLRFTARAG